MLRCVECGKETTGHGIDWRAYLTDDDEVRVFCPACAQQEFGVDLRRWPPDEIAD